MEEIWKTIEGFEDYEVSNYGRVKSLKKRKDKIKTLCNDSKGYYYVSLYMNGSNFSKKVHQLVAMAFLNHKPCGFKLVVNHKDSNRLNNHVDNLEIVTTRENISKRNIVGSSKYIGVYFNRKIQKWISSISINKKRIYLGTFNNELNAHLAYQNELLKL